MEAFTNFYASSGEVDLDAAIGAVLAELQRTGTHLNIGDEHVTQHLPVRQTVSQLLRSISVPSISHDIPANLSDNKFDFTVGSLLHDVERGTARSQSIAPASAHGLHQLEQQHAYNVQQQQASFVYSDKRQSLPNYQSFASLGGQKSLNVFEAPERTHSHPGWLAPQSPLEISTAMRYVRLCRR
jgi:hypothetical protein